MTNANRDRLIPNPARRRLVAAALALPVSVAARTGGAAFGEPLRVAAAADLKYALTDLVQRFEAQERVAVRLTFGSSGQIATQIRQGAPFHLFLSADERFALDLAEEGRTEGKGGVYAQGRIALALPPGSPLKADGTLADLGQAIGDGRLKRLAIANPEHAPYGERARQALIHAGLWEAIQPFLVFGENVAQALQFALSSAQGGIVSLSLVKAPPVQQQLGGFDLIPAQWHTPLIQRLVVLRGAPPAAHALAAFVFGPTGRAILAAYGFLPPEG